ncbi:MAG: class I SAM-dependent methyltransferase [Vicinamibacterales bacterium]|jgi:SAM-dependent methyltransferase
MHSKDHERVIRDFGQQWTHYTDNSGYYGSLEFFRELSEPLVAISEFRGLHVAEIGAGTGRISSMLLLAGASHVTALEPSDAVGPLRENLASFGRQVEIVHASGEELPMGPYDMVVSIGVLHHIPDPYPTVRAALKCLRPGGRLFVWVYGKEGNALYLAFALPLRSITKRLPHFANAALSWLLDIPLKAYILACRKFRLPLHEYMRSCLDKLSPDKRRLVIYDQLNPRWAKYYSQQEIRDLLERSGFENVRVHSRYGYSWAAVGVKP